MGCLNFSACQLILFSLPATAYRMLPAHTIASFLLRDHLPRASIVYSITCAERFGDATIPSGPGAGCVDWITHYFNFKDKLHPSNVGPPKLMAFLTYSAVERSVAPSMLAKAKSAILCLYRVRPNLVCTYFSARAVRPVLTAALPTLAKDW